MSVIQIFLRQLLKSLVEEDDKTTLLPNLLKEPKKLTLLFLLTGFCSSIVTFAFALNSSHDVSAVPAVLTIMQHYYDERKIIFFPVKSQPSF